MTGADPLAHTAAPAPAAQAALPGCECQEVPASGPSLGLLLPPCVPFQAPPAPAGRHLCREPSAHRSRRLTADPSLTFSAAPSQPAYSTKRPPQRPPPGCRPAPGSGPTPDPRRRRKRPTRGHRLYVPRCRVGRSPPATAPPRVASSTQVKRKATHTNAPLRGMLLACWTAAGNHWPLAGRGRGGRLALLSRKLSRCRFPRGFSLPWARVPGA